MSVFGLAFAAVLVAAPAATEPAAIAEAVHRRRVTAADGTALALYRYLPPGGGVLHRPVLLIADVGFGREAYDLGGDGLARYLQARGREVFVAELRGQGRAAGPKGWRLKDWLERDLPAIAQVIQAGRGARPMPIDLVAHGFAGSIALAASTAELSGRIGRVVALSTPVLPEVPGPAVERLLREGGRFASLDPKAFELVFAQGGRMPRGRSGALHGAARDLGAEAAADLLGWMQQGDLTLADGSSLRERLDRYERPTLLILALGDNFAHPEYAAPLRDLPRARVQVLVLSRAGFLKEDYTHLSMLHGTDAPEDVFEPVAEFLDGADDSPLAREPAPRSDAGR